MKLVALACVLAATGCFEDRYRCTTDVQCDVGDSGRCEVDGYCTRHDAGCPTGRRYTAHSEARSDTCFDDRIEPANACVGGQPPAPETGCFADVCAVLPACCDLGWTDACVPIAQQVCPDLVCDTRIAITATRGANTELVDARWDGTTWRFERRIDVRAPFAWLAPSPESVEPRLSAVSDGALLVGDEVYLVPSDRTYQSISSIGLDRDRRETLVTTYQRGMPVTHVVEVFDSRGSLREATVPASQGLTWGDINRDGFPDAVVKSNTQFYFLDNVDSTDHVRRLSNSVVANVGGSLTPGQPGVRHLDWLDFDGDLELDLAVFGASLRIHRAADGLRNAPEHTLDCDPPSTAQPCQSGPPPNVESATYAGAALPRVGDPALVVAVYPDRKLSLVRRTNGVIAVAPLPFPNDTCACGQTCTMCPGADCSCTYDCTSCPSVLAVVARDLDGDHQLDLVALDAKLQLYTALARTNLVFGPPVQVPVVQNNVWVNVQTSVAGAPR